jgi:hypothetical protein
MSVPPPKLSEGHKTCRRGVTERRISTMATSPEIDPLETPLDPEETQLQAPPSGTEEDDMDDEHWDENEPPDRALSDETDTRKEFRLDEREEEVDDDDDLAVDDEDDDVELK